MHLKKQFGYPAKRDPLSAGFTLIELLIVVLIIGILSAVAIPMYQGAVDKSNFSTMLSPTRSLKEAQEGVRMATGNYTDNAEDLDVTLSQDSLSYEFQTRDNGDEFNAIIATNPKLPNVRLARYLDENLLLAGQLHCQAKAGDERANRLCGPLLIGQELKDIDGYISYLLDEDIDQPTCDYAGKSFSTSKTKCYKDDATRCSALGMGYLGDGQCGYENTNGQTIGAEGVCYGSAGGCENSIIENGGECITGSGDHNTNNTPCYKATIKNGGVCRISEGSYAPCHNATVEDGGMCISDAPNSYGCQNANVKQNGVVICKYSNSCGWRGTYDGGICVAGPQGGCVSSTYKNGAICYANVKGGCGTLSGNSDSVYQDTSCCCGSYCPSYAPKCGASRCDPQYMSWDSFKDL